MHSEAMKPGIDLYRRSGKSYSPLLLTVMLIGLAYLAILSLSSLLQPYRFPIPYAVPIFDTPFVLAALAVGYLCLERHRLLQDFRSAAIGIALWLGALLAFAHILAQPDYPGTPGVNPGVAPYFFLSSYLTGLISIGLATHYGHHELRLSDLQRVKLGILAFAAGLLVVVSVLQFYPVLPSMVMKPGRFTPFGLWVMGVSGGLLGTWALWGGVKKFWGQERDWFAEFLLLAAVIWLLGLIGLFVYPFRYAVSWYVAGLARPLGVMAIFVGLLREQVWLYQEARARQHDLQGLHAAGQALVASLDAQQIMTTIAAKALEVLGAQNATLFWLDAPGQVLRSMSRAGRIAQPSAPDIVLPIGVGIAGLAVAQRQPVWTANLQLDARLALPPEMRGCVRQEGLKAGLAVPILLKNGEVFGALVAFYDAEREFAETDCELLSAFATQASVALDNANAFEQLAHKALHDAALQACGERLLEVTEEESILNTVVRAAHDLLQADYIGLWLFDPKTGLLRLEAGFGWREGTVGTLALPPSAQSPGGYAFLHKESVQVEDFLQEHRFSALPYLLEYDVRAGCAVPLGVHESPIGIIVAYYRTPHRFSDEEHRVLLNLTHQTALALEKVRLYSELQTNLRRLQETQAQLIQADKLKALGTLLSGMAHELNNPLSTILLSAELAKQLYTLPEPVQEQLDGIEQEAERASQIIKDLLTFARRQSPKRHQSDLNQVIEATLALQAPQFDLSNIRVITALAPALPHIWADSHQLQQVFLNLFVNATQAIKSAKGHGTLTVHTCRRESDVYVEIDDDGPGILPEYLGQIFDPFFTTKGAGEGTGLGLSVSLGIVESHGGQIQVKNLPGAGARFTIRLPIEADLEWLETSSTEAPG